MKDPFVVPWFLIAVTVIVWRLVKGWTFWIDLFAFGLASLAMLVMQQGLADGPVAEGSMRATGGAVLFTAAYWAFFDRAKAERGWPGDEINDARSAVSWDEWVLVGALTLQVVLELLMYGDAAVVPWFQVLYGVHALMVLVLIVSVLPKLVARTMTWWRR